MFRKPHKFISLFCLFAIALSGCCELAQCQDSLSDVKPSVVMGEPTSQSLTSFRKALIAAAEKSVKDKELSRLDLFRLRVATMNKATLEKMHQACAEQVLADGQAQSYGAIDWSKLLAAFKEFLPILLELIKLFADNGNFHQSQFIAYQGFNSTPLATGYIWADDLRIAA
jgi:hypothetical protein